MRGSSHSPLFGTSGGWNRNTTALIEYDKPNTESQRPDPSKNRILRIGELMKPFSKHELFKLRNRIDINMLIAEILKIPSKTTQARLRFLCPVCSQFNTATKRETNLARCFSCARNFNPIEMVMETKHLDFIHSVRFLQGLFPENESEEINANKTCSNPRLQCPTSSQIPKELVAMETLIKNIGIGKPEKLNQTSGTDLAKINQQDPAIGQLNERINQMSKQIDQLKSFIIDQFIEKSKNSR
jgi:hypothetical protein